MSLNNKKPARKKLLDHVWSDDDGEYAVNYGRLQPGPGRPAKTSRLFKFVAEKIPYEALPAMKKYLEEEGQAVEGVYLAHDSMGLARYGGRGQIFNRLASHKKTYPRQLMYFSFYVIENKAHEREIETVILRAAGPQMILNTRKVASGINPGDYGDYEPGTFYFDRRG